MPEIKIKGIPQELVDKLDSIVKLSKYPDRSALVIDVLNQYCLYHDNYYIKTLPDTTRILCEDAYKKGTKNIDEQLNLTLAVNKKCTQVMKELCDLLGADIKEQ